MDIERTKILTVDDEEGIRFIIASILQDHGFEVVEAEDGEHAKKILEKNDFDLILSDQVMPEMTGKELFTWVKKNKDTPFLLCTAHGDINSEKEALSLGMKGLIEKPFSNSELLKRVCNALEQPSEETKIDILYTKIGIHPLLEGEKIEFELHARLSGEKYIKLAHDSNDLDQERIHQLIQNGVRYLYLKNSDYERYLQKHYLLEKNSFKNSKIPFEKKKEFLKELGENIYSHVYFSGCDRISFTAAKQFIEVNLMIVTQDDKIFQTLTDLKNSSDSLYSHSLAVSTYCSMVYKNMGYESDQNMTNLAIAGLFHDIGKIELPEALTSKAEEKLTHMEEKQLQSHIEKGSALLKKLRSIPESIITMIEQHHEYSDGSGYPKKLRRVSIHPLSLFLICINDFVRRAQKHEPTENGVKRTIREMQFVYELYDEKVLKSLTNLFKKDDIRKKKLKAA